MQQWQNDHAEELSLDGEWAFSLDGESGLIHVPGIWEAQGYARRVDGPAIYQRSVPIPADWLGKQVHLQFDAVSYFVEVAINGSPVGTHSGLWTPFAFDVTDVIRPGQDAEIQLTIYEPGERFPMRESLAGFLPDVAIAFGGVWQSARLIAFDGPALSRLLVQAEAETGEVTISAQIHHGEGLTASIQVCEPDGSVLIFPAIVEGDQLTADLTLTDFQLWDSSQPNLYEAEIHLYAGETRLACASRKFGFRRLSADGEQLLLNSVPVSLRGVLNWGWYPEILCPAPDEAVVREEFRRVRVLGFNMVKLCLYVPSPIYFDIADEEGMLLWLEMPMWLPEVTDRLRQQAPGEYSDILSAINHHPSIVIYSLGCELNHSVDADLLTGLDGIARMYTRGVMICDNSGSGEAYGGLAFDFSDFNDYHFYCDIQYFDPLIDHFSRDWRPARPWIFGEFCDADDFRDLNEIEAAFNGHLPWWLTERNPLHPLTFIAYPEQRERMDRLELDFSHQDIQRISRQQSFVLRKTILEKTRARGGMGGYVVTSIRDNPLATSSLFDDLGRFKYAPDAFHKFNADTVLLLGRGRARTWTHGGDRPAPFDPYCFTSGQHANFDVILAHAGLPLRSGMLTWTLIQLDGETIAEGHANVPGPLQGGRPYSIARIGFDLPQVEHAAHVSLIVKFQSGSQIIDNMWPLWVFPEIVHWPDGIGLFDPSGNLTGLDDLHQAARKLDKPDDDLFVLLTSMLDENVMRYIQQGGKVVLLQTGDGPLPVSGVPFWREGIRLICDHPIMNAFPHQGYADTQFYGMATDWALETDKLTYVLPDLAGVRPMMRRLDARQFTISDYMLEMRVGNGLLIASTLRFWGGTGDQPASLRTHPAGRWLLHQLLGL